MFRKKSKNRHTNSKNGKDFICEYEYDPIESRPQITFKSLTQNKMDVKIQDIPEMSVAYVRHIGPYKGQSEVFEGLFNKLFSWAGPRGLITKDAKYLSVYYDDPNITEDSKLRTDVCISVPSDTDVKGEIGKQVLVGGRYAVARFELKGPAEYEKAWNSVYKDWLPSSGFQPDNRPPYEVYMNNPKEHPENIHIVDICVPVKEL